MTYRRRYESNPVGALRMALAEVKAAIRINKDIMKRVEPETYVYSGMMQINERLRDAEDFVGDLLRRR